MTRDEIIKLAREADNYADKHAPSFSRYPDEWRTFRDERFAALVAAHEREACAKVCESRYMGDNNREDMEAKRCAKDIRSRKN